MDFRLSIFWILLIISSSNASFFGLFNSKQVSEPDVIVQKPVEMKGNTDKIAYENYLQFLASTYKTYPTIQYEYIPIYYEEPKYIENIWSPQSQSPHKIQSHEVTSFFQEPIRVLPSNSLEVAVKSEKLEYEVPEPQIPTDLNDLPLSTVSQDFLTGGFMTKKLPKTIPKNPERSARNFHFTYLNPDGIKVSEQGNILRSTSGQEILVRRGQYGYIDAARKPVFVKWVADDKGYRLIN